MKLCDYSARWLDQIGSMKKPATIASMRSHVQKMDKFFGETDIEAVTEGDAQAYISSLFKQLSPQAVRTYWGTASLILTRAKKENLIESVPEPELPKTAIKPQLYFNTEQLQKLSRLNVEYFLLAETGLRAGELLGLKNSDIDFEHETLTVNRSVYAAKTQNPKTSNAFRTISISTRLCHALKTGYWNIPGEFLFPTRTGGPQYQTNVLRKLHADLQELDIPVTGFHAFRRGNATMLADLDVPVKTISYRQGRTCGNQTVDIYIQYKKLSDRDLANRVGEMLLNGK